MDLFSRNKPKEVAVAATTKVAPKSRSTDRDLSRVLQKPHITEKAINLQTGSVYTFQIDQNATKYDVRDAVKVVYNVTPQKVRIINRLPRQKQVRFSGKKATIAGQKKAYVYLKPGDSISLV